jgi:hypothetical protein
VYQEPDEQISFGDIFESEHLIDVHARADTAALGGGPMEQTVAQKIAKAMSKELTDLGGGIPMYTPANRAILLTDSCAVDTAMIVDRKGRRKRGRLLFAPVVLADEGEVERLLDQPQFDRFPLSPCDAFEHGAVAELRHCFMVDVRDLSEDDRITALDNEAAEDLEAAFAGYALRRGPLATERNVERLAELIAAELDPAKLEGVAELIGEVLDVAWRLESAVDDVAGSELSREKLDRLAGDLLTLEDVTRRARELLSSGREG